LEWLARRRNQQSRMKPKLELSPLARDVAEMLETCVSSQTTVNLDERGPMSGKTLATDLLLEGALCDVCVTMMVERDLRLLTLSLHT